MERGCPPPQPTSRSAGERRKSSLRVDPGRSPDRKLVLVHLELETTHLMATNLMFFSHFCDTQSHSQY